jgi:hypothetical protein
MRSLSVWSGSPGVQNLQVLLRCEDDEGKKVVEGEKGEGRRLWKVEGEGRRWWKVEGEGRR